MDFDDISFIFLILVLAVAMYCKGLYDGQPTDLPNDCILHNDKIWCVDTEASK